MLIDFSIQNFRSFFNRQSLSLRATRIAEYTENAFEHQLLDKKLLKAIAVYGANASGKSNLLRGMGMMKSILFSNFQQRSNERISFDPFLLNEGSKNEPTHFEVLFATPKHVFRYGFEFTDKAFVKEWLFDHTQHKEAPLFVRIEDGIQVFPDFPEGENLEEKTRDNALFISVVNQFNGPISNEIIEWFNNFNIIDGLGHTDYRGITFGMLENETTRDKLIKFYEGLGLGFKKLFIDKVPFDPNKLPFDIPEEVIAQMAADMKGKLMASLSSIHEVLNQEGAPVGETNFNVRTQESSGTNKLIDISGPIFDTLLEGGVLVVDELDAKLHPHLVIAVIRLFQLEETNPNNAQLIFATHNTNILSLGRLRRDQIVFAEKNRHYWTEIYPLVDYRIDDEKKVRNDRSFEKDYLLGRYGGVPVIADVSKMN